MELDLAATADESDLFQGHSNAGVGIASNERLKTKGGGEGMGGVV